MKTQIKKKHNLIALATFIVLGITISWIMYQGHKMEAGDDALILGYGFFGGCYFLAMFGWIQDMIWDGRREKEQKEFWDNFRSKEVN